MGNERQQEVAPSLSLQACLMNHVSMFSWSRQTVPSARAKPPVKCSVRLLQKEQKCCLSGGWGRMPIRWLHFKQFQLGGLLTVIAVTDNCWSFSARGNLGTCPVKILVACWSVCLCFKAGCLWRVEGINAFNFYCLIAQQWNAKIESSWLTWDHLRGSLYEALMHLSENAITDSCVCIIHVCAL